jgi:hypothetical protein
MQRQHKNHSTKLGQIEICGVRYANFSLLRTFLPPIKVNRVKLRKISNFPTLLKINPIKIHTQNPHLNIYKKLTNVYILIQETSNTKHPKRTESQISISIRVDS